MIKISNRQIVDVLRFSDDKAVLVEKKPNPDSTYYGVNYFILNFSTGEKEIVTKDAYLLKKYGTKRKEISEKLGNFVMPGAMILEDRSVLVIYPNGDGTWCDDDGNIYDFANGEDVYDENGVDYYYHGEPAYVRYMPKNQ